jgi:drug/metabolite transporter (DMT)-like permease
MVGTSHAGLPAAAFIAVRYGIACVLFLPLLREAGAWTRRELVFGALCGMIGISGYNLLSVIGARTVSAGMTGLLNGAEPLMIVLLGAIMRRRLPAAWTLAAAAIGLAGIVLLARGSGPALGDPLGIALTLTGALLWAVYCVLVPPLIAARGAITVTAVAMCAGAVPLLAAGGTGMPVLFHAMTGSQWVLTVMLAIGPSMISMLCWNAGTAALGAEKAGWFLYLLPLVSLVGGAAILGEPVKPVEIAGGGLILLSVFLSQR